MALPTRRETVENEIEWFLDHLKVERAASPNTIDAYSRDLRRFSEFVLSRGVKSVSDLSESTLADYRAYLKRLDLTTRSVARALSAIRSLSKFLIREGYGPEAVVIETTGFKPTKLLPKALTKPEVESLFRRPDISAASGLRDRTMMEMLYGTGLRATELVTLRREDYLPDESLIRVTGKRGKTRIIPLPAETHEWLRKYVDTALPALRKPDSGSHLFLNRRGLPLSRSGLFRILRRYSEEAGIEIEIGPHTLRHSYAVHLVQAGADLRSVQELLGHESISTTEVYTRLDLETVQRKYDSAHPRAKK